MNQHSAYIDARLASSSWSSKWQSAHGNLRDFTHDEIVRMLSDSVMTNAVQRFFTRAYVSRQTCPECGEPAQERCHARGEERPVLLKRALDRLDPDGSRPLPMLSILEAFFNEHKWSGFTFKCSNCHRKEGCVKRRRQDTS